MASSRVTSKDVKADSSSFRTAEPANDKASKAPSKSPRALKTISEAADMLDVPQHVLRFWETKFPQIKPMKRNGGRRYYRPEDIEVLQQVKHLLYKQGYTIKGARKAFEKDDVPGQADNAEGQATEALQAQMVEVDANALRTLKSELQSLKNLLTSKKAG